MCSCCIWMWSPSPAHPKPSGQWLWLNWYEAAKYLLIKNVFSSGWEHSSAAGVVLLQRTPSSVFSTHISWPRTACNPVAVLCKCHNLAASPFLSLFSKVSSYSGKLDSLDILVWVIDHFTNSIWKSLDHSVILNYETFASRGETGIFFVAFSSPHRWVSYCQKTKDREFEGHTVFLGPV